MSKPATPSNTPPDTLPDMIALYEEIARLTGRMLTAAQQRDWTARLAAYREAHPALADEFDSVERMIRVESCRGPVSIQIAPP